MKLAPDCVQRQAFVSVVLNLRIISLRVTFLQSRRPHKTFSIMATSNIMEIRIDGANWIRLAQDRVQWRAFVSTVMNLRVP
jgi:hypothetical protein